MKFVLTALWELHILFFDLYSSISGVKFWDQDYESEPFWALWELIPLFLMWISGVLWFPWFLPVSHLDNLLVIFLGIFIFGGTLDYFILSKISQKNFQKYPNNENNEKFFKKTRNELFIAFFVFWRIFLPDIFIFSTIFAKFCHIKFSQKALVILVFGTQLIRVGLFIASYLALTNF